MEKLKKVSTRGNFASLLFEAQEKYVKKKSCSGTPGVYINRSWGQKLVLGTFKNWPMSACGDTVSHTLWVTPSLSHDWLYILSFSLVNPLKATTIGRGYWNYDYIHIHMTYSGCHMSHISPLCVLYGGFFVGKKINRAVLGIALLNGLALCTIVYTTLVTVHYSQ